MERKRFERPLAGTAVFGALALLLSGCNEEATTTIHTYIQGINTYPSGTKAIVYCRLEDPHDGVLYKTALAGAPELGSRYYLPGSMFRDQTDLADLGNC